MDRDEDLPGERVTAERVRALVLPLVVLIVAVAIVSGLVFGGVVRGERAYDDTPGAPTTQPTVLIEPRVRRGWCA